MDKNAQIKKQLPIYNAPKDILNTMQLDENNEVVDDLNKKISESMTKKSNSKYRREISPERVDPMHNINKLNNNQNVNQRSYKEIMLEQKKLEEKEKNLRNLQKQRYTSEIDTRKSNQYNNINYNSRTLNQMSRRDFNESNSIYTKETKNTSEINTNINRYEKKENDDFLAHKRKKDINENFDEDYFKFNKPINNERHIEEYKNEEKS